MSLVQELVRELIEDKPVALFGGGFKPPTRGHLEVVLRGLQEHPEVKHVQILVGQGSRNNISQGESVKIWKMYQKFIPVPSEIIPVVSPFKYFKDYLTDHSDEKVYIFIGARPDNEDDDKDVEQRSKYVKKYSDNVVPVRIQTSSGISGTKARNAALSDNTEEFLSYFPPQLSDSEKQTILDMIISVVKETSDPDDSKAAPFGSGYDTVDEKKDPKKGTGKKPEGSGRRLYTDEDPKDTVGIKFSTRQDIVDTLNKTSFKAKSHARQSQIINLIHQRVRAAYGRAKDPAVKKRLKSGLDYITKKKEASKKKTQRLKKLNENASYSKDIDIKDKIDQLTQHMIDKGMNIEPLPSLEFVDGDTENARDFFGKTAYYDPNTQTIVLYTEGRHPKDIARSYAHEMIHHMQNIENRLGRITTQNTQEDDHLNDIEAEANLKGTMTFRNWTDSLNEIGDASAQKLEWNPAKIERIAKEIERKIEKQYDDTVEYYDMLPPIEVISPESRTRYRVTVDASVDKPEDELAMTTLRVDFTTEEGGDNAINKGEQYKILATLTDIIIQLINRVNDIDSTTLDLVKFYAKDDTEGKYANSDSKRGKLYQAFINKNLSKLPGNWKMSTSDEVIMLSPVVNEDGKKTSDKNMGDYKKSNDPFGLLEGILNEGAYDALTTKLTKATITKWVEDSKQKPIPKKSFVDIDIDEVDGKGREIEFNYVGLVEFDKTIDGYEVDGTSNSGEEDDKFPFIATLFKINPKVLPQAWSKISADVSDVIRHEIEHLTQAGDNTRSGKYMDDDIQLRDMINKAKVLPQSDYYKLEKEVDAMLQGLYLKAKKTKKPFSDVVKNYLNIAPGIKTKEDKEIILNLWRSRRNALSLPVFETRYKLGKVMKEEVEEQQYKIYCDMDGVITDFDTQFKRISGGVSPSAYESKYGTDEFWSLIRKEGVGYWVGMPWMPKGKELWEFISQYNPTMLSAPSKENESRLGKRLWVRNNLSPKPKLILASSNNKQNYSKRNRILIDDRPTTINQWIAKGGIGILFKSTDQVIKELQELGL